MELFVIFVGIFGKIRVNYSNCNHNIYVYDKIPDTIYSVRDKLGITI